MRTRNLAVLALGLALTLAACSTGGQSAGTSTSGGNPTANGAEGFEGTLATSGRYAATWTASQDAKADRIQQLQLRHAHIRSPDVRKCQRKAGR